MPDFVMLAQAFGIKGMQVLKREDLSTSIAEMLAYDGPVFMDVKVTRDENCYPMVAPGKSNAQMMGLIDKPKLEIAAELINCGSCGAKTVSSNNFCPECGAKL